MPKAHSASGKKQTDKNSHAQFLATQLIDPETIATYHQIGKLRNKNIVKLILEKYLHYSHMAITDLSDKVHVLDFKSIELIAHTLKSSSAQVGAFSLSALFEQIEKDAETQQTGSLNTTKMAEIVALQADVHQAIEYIASHTKEWLRLTED
jgi:HPt (histidine-containing phosphotransfer) domain-containing protein